MPKFSETLADPRKAALVGAAAGAVKGLLVGVISGKLLLFTLLGAAGGAATAMLLPRLLRGKATVGESSS